VASDEMERVFNMGVGMAAVVAPGAADHAIALLTARGIPAWQAGEVTRSADAPGIAQLVGAHPG
jgi:phosphoribosylformylglycinamidine cyclo-ligase